MVYRVTTHGVRESEQLGYWQSQAIERYYVRVEATDNRAGRQGYGARMHGLRFGGWSVNDLHADPIRLNRLLGVARSEPADYVQVSLHRAGRVMVMQHGRVAIQSEPGDVVFIDPMAPYIFEFERRAHQIQVQIPREQALRAFPELSEMTAMTVPGRQGLGLLSGQMLSGINEYRSDRADELSYATTVIVLDLLVEAARNLAGSASVSPADALILQAQRYIGHNMADSDAVTPARIAAAISVSERYLYKLFERVESTPRAWLREVRLSIARRMLLDGRNRMSVQAIGRSVGFRAAAHFSRAFSARYGTTPSETRALASQTV